MKESSSTIKKFRDVFDVFFKTTKEKSLNKILHVRPKLNQCLRQFNRHHHLILRETSDSPHITTYYFYLRYSSFLFLSYLHVEILAERIKNDEPEAAKVLKMIFRLMTL